MEKFKMKNVVMLPTNKKAGLVLNDSTRKIQYCDFIKDAKCYTDTGFRCFHLYITSDEDVKAGDCYIKDNIVHQRLYDKTIIPSDSEKVIATTDTSLLQPTINFKDWDGLPRTLPQPSQAFIDAYITAYNAETPISKVMVVYKTELPITCNSEGIPNYPILKVDKNNTITIRKVKETFTLQEFSDAFKQEGIYYSIEFLTKILNNNL